VIDRAWPLSIFRRKRCALTTALIMRWTPPADGIDVPRVEAVSDPEHGGSMQVTTIGLDIAKNTFQVHGIDRHGQPVLKRKLSRGRVLEFLRHAAALPGRP
jgi:hypothetical protein